MHLHLIHCRKAKRVDTVNNFRRIEQMVPDDLLKYGSISLILRYTLVFYFNFTVDHIVIYWCLS